MALLLPLLNEMTLMSPFDLELKKLCKVYADGTLAVEAFDLTVKRGEFISFVGPSGCGKTTTLRMIAGLEDITSGQLLIRGEDFTEVPVEKRPTSTIFQNYAIFPHMTVRQNIEFGLQVRKVAAPDMKRRVDDMIDKLQLGDVASKKEEALSGGQKQRLALARGLVTEPDILLLDEPLGALDANLRKSIQEELKILQRSLGITFIFVTHAQSEALSMGDRIVVMNSGRVEQISTPFELYTRPVSPFVAEFIGKNLIIPGAISDVAGATASIETNLGTLGGTLPGDASAFAGDKAMLVVPSEYVEIRKLNAEITNSAVNGTVATLSRVGQVVLLDIVLGDDLHVKIETHSDNFSEMTVETGEQVTLRWQPERATLVKGNS